MTQFRVSDLHDPGSRKGAKAAKKGDFPWRSWRLGVRMVNDWLTQRRKGAKAAKKGDFPWRSWRLGVRLVND
jgi:hypothetical protein